MNVPAPVGGGGGRKGEEGRGGREIYSVCERIRGRGKRRPKKIDSVCPVGSESVISGKIVGD